MADKELTIDIKNLEVWVLIVFLSLVFIMAIQVTLYSPIVFGDEGFHIRMAQWMAENAEYPVWKPFQGTSIGAGGYHRPPLWNLLEGGFFLIFGFSEFIAKVLTPFIAVLVGIVTYVLVKKLYNRKIGLIATILTLTMPSFVTYSVLFYVDALVTLFLTLFFFLFILGIRDNKKKYLLLSCVFGSLAILTKTTSLIVYPFIFLAFLYELWKRKGLRGLIKKYSIILGIILVLHASFYIRSIYHYKTVCGLPYLNNFISDSGCDLSGFEQKYKFAGRTEQVGSEQNVFSMGITNYLTFAYGNIWFVIFGVMAGLFLILKRRSKTDILIFLTFLMFLPIFFYSTSRAEDTSRYTLSAVPIISVIAAKYFNEVYKFIKRYQKYIALGVFVLVFYLGFMSISEKLPVMAQVKQFSPSFFEACDWVDANLPEDVRLLTVWSHRAVYNCQRNIAGNFADISLSRDLDYTLEMSEMNGITHIFIQKFSIDPLNQHFSEKYDAELVQFLENNPDHFEKIYENGPPIEQCLQGGCDGNVIYEIVS